jgi:hypothetical protein
MSDIDMPVAPTDKQMEVIFYFGAYPLWKFLSSKFNIDIREICDKVAIDEPTCHQPKGVYTIRVVDNEYNHNLNKDHNENITFLLNSVNIVFNILKEGIIKNGEHILKPFHFQLDDNRNLELVLIENPIEQEYLQSINNNIKIGVVLIDNRDE